MSVVLHAKALHGNPITNARLNEFPRKALDRVP
jgi:hypothetical protein